MNNTSDQSNNTSITILNTDNDNDEEDKDENRQCILKLTIMIIFILCSILIGFLITISRQKLYEFDQNNSTSKYWQRYE